MKLSDLTNRRFGRLLVVERGADMKPGRPSWVCRCDCARTVTVAASSLRTGNTRSCGCLAAASKRTALLTHGHSASGRLTPEYVAWANMVSRGTGKVNRANYVDRGIDVCERWLTFENFLADMGERPIGTSIDRVDNDRGYCPENCRWATRREQQRNTRANHVLSVGDRVASIAEWAESTGLKSSTIQARIARGWSAKDAISRATQHGEICSRQRASSAVQP